MFKTAAKIVEKVCVDHDFNNKNLVTKVKAEKFHSQLKSHTYNKTIIEFNFGRHKDLSTLKSDILLSGR